MSKQKKKFNLLSILGLAILVLTVGVTSRLAQSRQYIGADASRSVVMDPNEPLHWLNCPFNLQDQGNGTYILYCELWGNYPTNPAWKRDRVAFSIITGNTVPFSEESEGWFDNKCPGHYDGYDFCDVTVTGGAYNDVWFEVYSDGSPPHNSWYPDTWGPVGQNNKMGYVRILFQGNPGCVELEAETGTGSGKDSRWQLYPGPLTPYSDGKIIGYGSCQPNPTPTPPPTTTPTPTPTATPTPTPTPTPPSAGTISGVIHALVGDNWLTQEKVDIYLTQAGKMIEKCPTCTKPDGKYTFTGLTSGVYQVHACKRIANPNPPYALEWYYGNRLSVSPPDPMVEIFMTKQACPFIR